MDNLRLHLKTYLENLVLGIQHGHSAGGITQQIISESDLERYVRVGNAGDITLLRLLGFTEENVDDHASSYSVMVGTNRFVPDYVLHGQNNELTILELKKPDEDLDNKNYAGQVLSYCKLLKAPIGLLFNGFTLRVFINTEIRQFNRYRELFEGEPIAAADYNNMAAMTELLSKFSAESLQANPIRVAQSLASRQAKILHGRKRQDKLRATLSQTLGVSPPCDLTELLSALATIDSLWADFDPKPTPTELAAAWKNQGDMTPPHAGSRGSVGANPALRAKIAEVCTRKGWAVIEQARLRGLNYRLTGVEDKGFILVPGGTNVPPGLCVQGKDTKGALRLIDELDNLLHR